jgi:hypothetical protein
MVAANDTLPAVSEELTIPALHGSAAYDITEIDGIALSRFTHVQIHFEGLARAVTGSHLEVQFSSDGGSTWLGGPDYRTKNTNSITTNPATGSSIRLTAATSMNTMRGTLYLSSFNQPCPTGVQYANLDTDEAFPFMLHGMTTAATVHDAIRFLNGANWTGGVITITGYRCKVGTLYSHTFTGEASVDFDLAKDEVIADVFNLNVTTSSGGIGVEVGTGGTYVSTGYVSHLVDSSGSTAGTSTSIYFSTGAAAAAGKFGVGRLYNLQTAAPVCAQGGDLSADGGDPNPQELRGFVLPGTTSYDQLRVKTGGVSLDAGTVYIQTYKPKRTILAVADLAGLDPLIDTSTVMPTLTRKNGSLIVISSTDAARPLAVGSLYHLSRKGGVATATGTLLWVDETSNLVASTQAIYASDTSSRVECGIVSTIIGLPQQQHTAELISHPLTPSAATNMLATSWSSDVAEKQDGLESENIGNGVWSAGFLTYVGYSM